MLDIPSTIKYPLAWGFKREPARPPHLRIDYCGGMKFDDNFDWDNLWYDATQLNPSTVLLIGAPLYGTKDWLQNNATFETNNGTKLSFRFAELDRVCYTIVTVSEELEKIYLVTNTERTEIKINHNDGQFNGIPVMVTLQKDNPISWITQWIRYHSEVMGVGGFLIYDNGSTKYSLNELEAALSKTKAKVRVVSWPYPYGPQGSDFAPWDSDYGQYVMLEHAKWRYLSGSSLVLNNDVDELVVTKGINLRDIAEFLRNNNSCQCIRYRGIWIEPYDIVNKESANTVPFEHRRFKDYYCTDDNNKIGIGYKWLLMPSQNNINQQWLVHHINGPMIESDQMFYAHYMSMNTNWSWSRDHFKGKVEDLVVNQHLLDKFNRMVD